MEVCGFAAVSSERGDFVEYVPTVVDFEGSTFLQDAPGWVVGDVEGRA